MTNQTYDLTCFSIRETTQCGKKYGHEQRGLEHGGSRRPDRQVLY